MNTNQQLFSYISACKTPYQAIAHTGDILKEAGFTQLCESKPWALTPGKRYFTTRNGSSLIAFKLPEALPQGFMMTAAHCDSPAFKIKENPELSGDAYVRLSTEKYGGMLCSTWMDRPLSIAGRIVINTETGIETRLVDFGDVSAIIPSVAIHMNRSANDSASFNAAVDMLPLYMTGKNNGSFKNKLCEVSGVCEEAILSTDLFLYNPQPGIQWNDFISAPRLDDLQCAFGSLQGFLNAENSASVTVYCLFDNEEVGSQTKQGVASTFLKDVLSRITASYYSESDAYTRMLGNSFLVSCDNAHAVHPNHGEFSDKNHSVLMNGGIVIKYNANQKYTSDAVSSAIFRRICSLAGVPCQSYANRADMAGGSTLGNISNTQVSLNTVDIGLAQLAMHSSFETAGKEDTEHLVKALTEFFSKSVIMEEDGVFSVK